MNKLFNFRFQVSGLRFLLVLLSALISQLSPLALGQTFPTASFESVTKTKATGDAGLLTAGFHVGTGKTITFDSGSTLTLSGALSGTPTGGTLNLSALTLTLPSSFATDSEITSAIAALSTVYQPLNSNLTTIDGGTLPSLATADGFALTSAGSIALTAGGTDKGVNVTIADASLGAVVYSFAPGSATGIASSRASLVFRRQGGASGGAGGYMGLSYQNAVEGSAQPGLFLGTANGTILSPATMTAAKEAAVMYGYAYASGAFQWIAGITYVTESAFSDSAYGGGIDFYTRPTGQTSLLPGRSMRLAATTSANGYSRLLVGRAAVLAGDSGNGQLQIASTSSSTGLALGTRSAEVIYRTGNDVLQTDSAWKVNSTTASTTTGTGSGIFAGGIGVAGQVTANNWSSTISGFTALINTNGAGGNSFIVTGAVANRDLLTGQTLGSNRWILRVDSTAESGGNAGSDFAIRARSDTGSDLGAALSLTRSSLNASIGGDLTISGGDLALTGTSSIAGGAGNMTITAGTGASRTLTFQTTTSGSVATNALVLDALQGATFSGLVTVSSGYLSVNSGSGTNTLTLRDGTMTKTAGSGFIFSTGITDIAYISLGTTSQASGTFWLAHTNTSSSGEPTGIFINKTWNQTGSAGSADLKINRNDTALGSGAHYLIVGQVSTVNKFSVLNTGAITTAATITTGAPTGGTSAAWKLGTVASVSPTSPNRTIEVEVGGTTYYVHAKTTNN